MLEYLYDSIKQYSSKEQQFAELREHLQLLILDVVSKRGYFQNIAFLGGTSLRILYKIRRYSEDLDFSLVNKDAHYDFNDMIEIILKELQLKNLNVDIKLKRELGVVRSCFYRFKGLLYELGLSPLKDQKLAIKFDIDENPPLGFNTELSMVTNFLPIAINHFDKASLFSGKLHAILQREYTKGRDYFDLIWFINDAVSPNIELLQNALAQSSGKKVNLNIKLLKSMLKNRIETTDFRIVVEDLRPFIMDANILEYYTPKYLLKLIDKIQ